MARWLLAAALLMAVATVYFSTRGDDALAAGPCGTSAGGVSPEEQALVSGINDWRASSLGQPSMANSVTANYAAQIHADALIAGTASGHSDSFGRLWADRLRDCGYPPGYVNYGSGEAVEVLTGQGDATAALAAMTTHQGSQSGVQAPVPWECSGVGYASGGGKFAWVVIVASAPSKSLCPQTAGQTVPGSTTVQPPATATKTPTITPTATPTRKPVFQSWFSQLARD